MVQPPKSCTRCKVVKPLSAFSPHNGKKDGHQSWCRDCYREHAANKQPLGRAEGISARIRNEVIKQLLDENRDRVEMLLAEKRAKASL